MNKKMILKILLKVTSLLYLIGYIFYASLTYYFYNKRLNSLSGLLMMISFAIINSKEKFSEEDKKYEKIFKILRTLGNIVFVIGLLVYIFLEIKKHKA